MSDTTKPTTPFGVGSIIGNTFEVWFRNIVPIFLASIIPQIIVYAAILLMFGAEVLVSDTPVTGDEPRFIIGNVVLAVLGLVAAALTTAVVVRIAYDSVSGRPVNIGAAISGALPHILPIAVLSFAAALAAGVGFMLLIIPGLYLYAMWSVAAPAIVVERAGFSGLGRSAALTKHYRWPIIGTFVILGIILIVISLILAMIIGVIAVNLGLIAAVILQLVLYSVLYGPFYVVIAMIYARLREIKEGIVVQDLADIFA